MIRKNGRGSLPAREKPVDQGSNPCVPTFPSARRHLRGPATLSTVARISPDSATLVSVVMSS